MPNTEAVLPFTSISRRCNLRMVGGGAARALDEVCARAAIGDVARVAAPPPRIARLDSMRALSSWTSRRWRARIDAYQVSIPNGTCSDRRSLLNDKDARRSEPQMRLLDPAICASLRAAGGAQ